MRNIIILVLLFLASVASVTTSHAQQTCFERSVLVDYLADNYKEFPVSVALAANGSLLEVLSTPDGSSWTVVLTQPDDITCVMASGEAWINTPLPIQGDEH